MELFNLKNEVVLVLFAAIAIAASSSVQAEEAGFTLEDSIRQQIFVELKSNVTNLYQNSGLVVPSVDTGFAARVASLSDNSNSVLPLNAANNAANTINTVEIIN